MSKPLSEVEVQRLIDERLAPVGSLIRQLQGLRWDSGWIAEEANTNHLRSLTHGLNLDLATHRPRLTCWFAPTDPALGAPAFVAPKPLRGMQVDDAIATSQGYDNPSHVALWATTLELSFYSPMPLHSIFNPMAGAWTLYQTGWLRFLLTVV